jgi:hypothetical protein
MSNSPDKQFVSVSGPTTGGSVATSDPERRQALRYPFTAAAEVVEVFSQARVTGRTSDLGTGGCYIDALTPHAVGATVRLRIERERRVFEAVATVIYAHLSMGMGLVFTDIKPEHRAVLESWMAELNGERSPSPDAASAGVEAGPPPELVTERQVLNELINLMVRKKIISDYDGVALLRRMFR